MMPSLTLRITIWVFIFATSTFYEGLILLVKNLKVTQQCKNLFASSKMQFVHVQAEFPEFLLLHQEFWWQILKIPLKSTVSNMPTPTWSSECFWVEHFAGMTNDTSLEKKGKRNKEKDGWQSSKRFFFGKQEFVLSLNYMAIQLSLNLLIKPCRESMAFPNYGGKMNYTGCTSNVTDPQHNHPSVSERHQNAVCVHVTHIP